MSKIKELSKNEAAEFLEEIARDLRNGEALLTDWTYDCNYPITRNVSDLSLFHPKKNMSIEVKKK